jgi:hypothetical protein
MFQIILVGFLPTANGHSCNHHPFGCSNTLVLEHESHGAGLILLDAKFKLMDLMVTMCASQLENTQWELVAIGSMATEHLLESRR